MKIRNTWALACGVLLLAATAGAARAAAPYFEVRVVDEATSRGVPLVELETTHGVRYVTDSAGRAAILEPGLEGIETWFKVTSHGYEYPKDGFGFRGFRAVVRAGAKKEIKIKRINIAERLYRITGEGIYRDSVLLSYQTPLKRPLLAGQVMGQDSVFALPYRGKLFWFWGDTNRPSYPLGQFRMAGATTPLPGQDGLDPDKGVDLEYFTDPDGFSRPMAPLPEDKGGVVWAAGFAVVPDESGRDTMVAYYSRRKGLADAIDHGLIRYNDKKEIFEKAKMIDLKEKWRFPETHPIRVKENGVDYLVFPRPLPTVRVPATWAAIQDASQYEAFTCLTPGTKFDKDKSRVERDAQGRVVWSWKKDCDPITQAEETELVKAGLLKTEEARFQFVDAASGKPMMHHGGSFYWNDYLKEYVMIGAEMMGTSVVGEIWFAHAKNLTGPWRKAVKVVTHDKYSFYNPTQHPFFDQQGGRIIYFEGTYTESFSGAPVRTPRYDYNQVMYRLDLADPRLKAAGK